jgi:hypothetical protein
LTHPSQAKPKLKKTALKGIAFGAVFSLCVLSDIHTLLTNQTNVAKARMSVAGIRLQRALSSEYKNLIKEI